MSDECCLNCSYWNEYRPAPGYIDGMICTKGHGHTAPDDWCCECNELIYTNAMNMGGGISYFERESRLRTYNNWLNSR
ncbi:MAG: hypothetical protein Q4P14_01175 [Methanobacteriaceae archaeon]|nr:hypothetical protein [Methanobacteriaceae archaeon]